MSAVLRQGIRPSMAVCQQPPAKAQASEQLVVMKVLPCLSHSITACTFAGPGRAATGARLQEGLLRCSASQKSPAPIPLRVSAAAISCSMAARSAGGMPSGALQQRMERASSGLCAGDCQRGASALRRACGRHAHAGSRPLQAYHPPLPPPTTTTPTAPHHTHLPRLMRRITQSAAHRTRLAMSSPLRAGNMQQHGTPARWCAALQAGLAGPDWTSGAMGSGSGTA